MYVRVPARDEKRRVKDRGAVAEPAAMAPPHVLALQRTAGNQAVGRMLAASRSRVARLESGKHVPGHETVNNYIALINGLNYLTNHWRQPDRLDLAPSPDSDLTARHRAMLVRLQTALQTLHSSPGTALTLWEQLLPVLQVEIRRGGIAGLTSDDVAAPASQLDYLTRQLFQPGAYQEAKRDAKASADVEHPDAEFETEAVERAEEEFNAALQLFEQTKKLGSTLAAGDPRVKMAQELLELAAVKGGIEEKLAYARKHGLATTGTEIVAKLLGATKGLVTVSAEIGEKVFEARRAAALARGAKEAAEQMEHAAHKFARMAKMAERIGKVGTALALIGDGVRLVAALIDGDIDAALTATLDTATDVAPLVFGADVAGPLAVAVVVVKAELEVWRSAAALIRYCHDQQVREAAEAFVRDCDKVLTGAALDLIADVEIMLDPTRASLQAIAQQQAVREGKRVAEGMRMLNEHVLATVPTAIGGHPSVVHALGPAANAALMTPFPDPPLAALQIQEVFKGANAMVAYVKDRYTN